MTRLHVLLIVLGLLAVAYFVGHYRGVDSVKPVIVETVKEVKGETQIVYKDRVVTKVVTKIQKPDGTIITRETDKTKDVDKTTDKKIDKTVDAQTPVADDQKNYEAGLGYRLYQVDDLKTFDAKNVEVRVGRRIGGDVWLEGAATQKDVTLGITYKWK